jgi:hypothetical protein
MYEDTRSNMEYIRQTITERMIEDGTQEPPAYYAAAWQSTVNLHCSTYTTDTYKDIDGTVKTCSEFLKQHR